MPRPVEVLPDVPLALILYLRTVPALTAIVPADRITTKLPAAPAYPVVLLNRGGGQPVIPMWLDQAAMQVDTLGGTHEECSTLARTVAAAITAIANDTTTAGVLVSAATEVGPQWLPDTTVTPPLARFVGRYAVLAHR